MPPGQPITALQGSVPGFSCVPGHSEIFDPAALIAILLIACDDLFSKDLPRMYLKVLGSACGTKVSQMCIQTRNMMSDSRVGTFSGILAPDSALSAWSTSNMPSWTLTQKLKMSGAVPSGGVY